MTRTIASIIATICLALAGCQEGEGLEQAPEGPDEEGAEIEKASGLTSTAPSTTASSPSKEQMLGDQLAAAAKVCASLAEQLKALLEQIESVEQQRVNADKMLADLRSSEPVRGNFESDEAYDAARSEFQAKLDAARQKVANLDAQLKKLRDQETTIRAKMKAAGCGKVSTIGSTAFEEPSQLEMIKQQRPSLGDAKLPSSTSGSSSPSSSVDHTASDSAIRNAK